MTESKCLHFRKEMLTFQKGNAYISERKCLHFRKEMLTFQKENAYISERKLLNLQNSSPNGNGY
jgi:hypothetical protein